MLEHLKLMADVRPGIDGEATRWAVDEIGRLRAALQRILDAMETGFPEALQNARELLSR